MDLDKVLLLGTLCKGSLWVMHSWSRSSIDSYGAWCDAVVGLSSFCKTHLREECIVQDFSLENRKHLSNSIFYYIFITC